MGSKTSGRHGKASLRGLLDLRGGSLRGPATCSTSLRGIFGCSSGSLVSATLTTFAGAIGAATAPLGAAFALSNRGTGSFVLPSLISVGGAGLLPDPCGAFTSGGAFGVPPPMVFACRSLAFTTARMIAGTSSALLAHNCSTVTVVDTSGFGVFLTRRRASTIFAVKLPPPPRWH